MLIFISNLILTFPNTLPMNNFQRKFFVEKALNFPPFYLTGHMGQSELCKLSHGPIREQYIMYPIQIELSHVLHCIQLIIIS